VGRDLVALLLHSTEAREALLPMVVEAGDLAHAPFRTIVAALRLRLSAPAESLMTDLVTDEARSVLAALLVEERAELDVRVSIEQFRRRLERSQRLRRAREVSQSIADVQANAALPSDIVSRDQLDDIMMMFGAMDIEVVDSAKAGRLPSEVGRERQPAPAEEADDDGPADSIDLTPGPVGRTEDPVRLYLREMGRVALLARDGGLALAKR